MLKLNIKGQFSYKMQREQSPSNSVVDESSYELEVSQINGGNQSMRRSSNSYRHISGILAALPQEIKREEQHEREQEYEQRQPQNQRSKFIEENQRRCMFQLIYKNSKNGKYNKMMIQKLVPDLESKIKLNNQDLRRKRLQEESTKYAIIGFKAKKIGIKQGEELKKIVQKYKQYKQNIPSQPRKKVFLFLYEMLDLIESVKLMSANERLLQYKSMKGQMALNQNMQIFYEKYEIIGNQISQILDKQKQKLIEFFKSYFNSKAIRAVDKSLIFFYASQVILKIHSRQGQSTEVQGQIKKENKEHLIQEITKKGDKLENCILKIIIAILLVFVLKLSS